MLHAMIECPATGESMKVRLEGMEAGYKLGTLTIDGRLYHLEFVDRDRIRSRENPWGEVVVDTDPDYEPEGRQGERIAVLVRYGG